MGDDRTGPEGEMPKRPGAQGMPAQGASRGAAPDEPAAETQAVAYAEPGSGRMQTGAAVPRLEVRLPLDAEGGRSDR